MNASDKYGIVVRDCGEPLVNLSHYDFILEPMYFKTGYSSDPNMYIRKGVAEKLLQLQRELPGKYRFKIWDGWRPREVQQAIYNSYLESLRNEHPAWDKKRLLEKVLKFIASPTNQLHAPPHSTGGAVDLTLVDAKEDELNMGTIFDFFGPEAGSMYFEEHHIDSQVRNNRRILRNAMTTGGFLLDELEWWDYNYGNICWASGLGHSEAIYAEVSAAPS